MQENKIIIKEKLKCYWEIKKRKNIRLHAVLAQSLNKVIGNENDLPWHEPEDLTSFFNLTKNSYLIMGRKTWECFEKPLPKRISIVLSRKKNLQLPKEAIHAKDIETTLENIEDHKTVFVVGGAEIYKLFFDLLDEIWLTIVKNIYVGDISFDIFSHIDANEWEVFRKEILNKNCELISLKRKETFIFYNSDI